MCKEVTLVQVIHTEVNTNTREASKHIRMYSLNIPKVDNVVIVVIGKVSASNYSGNIKYYEKT